MILMQIEILYLVIKEDWLHVSIGCSNVSICTCEHIERDALQKWGYGGCGIFNKITT